MWTGTQTPFNVRRELAGAFGLDEADVRVVSPPMGGSFGAKTFTRIEAIAAALARKAARPVRIVLPRAEVFVTLVRHPARFRVRLGARRDGTFVARRVWADWDTGAYADTGPNVAAKGGWAAVGPYRFDHVEVDSRCVYTNSPSAGAFRGYAATQAVWASEQCVDLLAEQLGADPLELRLRNVLRDGDRFATGETMHDFHVAECLERVAERIGWSAGRRGNGPLRRHEGHADAEPLGGPHRPRRRPLHGRERDDRHRPGTRPEPPAARRLLARLRRVDHRHRRRRHGSLAVRLAHHLEPLGAHDVAGAIGNAARDLRRRVADELEANPADVLFVGDAVEIVGSPGTRRALASFGSLEGSGEWVLDGGLEPETGQGIASGALAPGRGRAACRDRPRDGRRRDRGARGRGLRRPRRRRLGRRRSRTTARS